MSDEQIACVNCGVEIENNVVLIKCEGWGLIFPDGADQTRDEEVVGAMCPKCVAGMTTAKPH